MNRSIFERQLNDWKIKYSNLVIAKEISENKLNEEIKALKKELAQKDKQIDSLYEIIKKMDTRLDALTLQVAELTKENIALKETIVEQSDQIEKLKSRINKDSNNSSKPSSTNGFKKPIQNNREISGKKVGGQLGHKGSGLKQFPDPTEIINKKILFCDATGCDGEVINDNEYTAKQKVDIKIMLEIIEERIYAGICNKCGKRHVGRFSQEYINPIQYGNNIKSLITILNSRCFVSINKTTDILNSITGNQLNISDATVVNIQNSFSNKLEPTINSIKENLIKCNVLHADETGCRINAKTNWVQVFSNKFFTLCSHDKKRGSAPIEDMGVLDYFIGILVHDHFSAYYKNTLVTHSECNAHILRYLKNIKETFKREWAKEMIEHLVDSLDRKKENLALGINSLDSSELEKISIKYSEILEKGQKAYEETIKGKKNISYFNDERLLLKRMREFKDEHLRFITNFEAPFDNNQAERDIRSIKTKTKVSGCFRSDKGTEAFTKIYSLISTLKKQDMNIYNNIGDIFNGKKLTFP